MRFFLYTYSDWNNYELSRKMGVFGAPEDGTGIGTKVQDLKRNDLILIREGGDRDFLEFCGYCRVVGDVFNQTKNSPFKELLWPDELAQNKTLYSFRVAVDFIDVPKLDLTNLLWTDFDSLGFHNEKGLPIKGVTAWTMKFRGNYVDPVLHASEFKSLSTLLKFDGVSRS